MNSRSIKFRNPALWQVLRIYDVDGKLLNGIKSRYVDSVACVRVKGHERECFRTESGERRLNYVPLALQCAYRYSDERSENEDREVGSEVSGGEREEISWLLV